MNNPVNHVYAEQPDRHVTRRSSQSHVADVLADIYEDDVNIAIWERALTLELCNAAQSLLESSHAFRISTSVTPTEAADSLYEAMHKRNSSATTLLKQ